MAAAAAKSLQSCPTLCDPIDGSPPGSPAPGFSRQEHWSGLPFPSPWLFPFKLIRIKWKIILVEIQILGSHKWLMATFLYCSRYRIFPSLHKRLLDSAVQRSYTLQGRQQLTFTESVSGAGGNCFVSVDCCSHQPSEIRPFYRKESLWGSGFPRSKLEASPE